MWTCPKCKRTFIRREPYLSTDFKGNPVCQTSTAIKNLYNQLVKIVKSFGKYREETVLPDVIFIKTKSTFMAVKVKRDHLDIDFFLDHLENVPPVSKYLQASKHRIAHVSRMTALPILTGNLVTG